MENRKLHGSAQAVGPNYATTSFCLHFICLGLFAYTRCSMKKGPLFVFFIIHSNDDQFTQHFNQL